MTTTDLDRRLAEYFSGQAVHHRNIASINKKHGWDSTHDCEVCGGDGSIGRGFLCPACLERVAQKLGGET